MPKLIATHEVEDQAHWLASPKRAEVFAGIARDIQTFVHPDDPHRVAVSMQVDDMAAFEKVLQSEAGAEAMKHDGVRPETVVIYSEG
ncbi:hypothetical protein [Cribrihabitans pelagius]|uniref:hypothetical protein n=1 Tax=Cribrihabitans pelagius TaxID=1765746 RepID=UPI003B5CA08C